MELKSLFDLSKLPSKILFVFAVISGFLLSSSKSTLLLLHLENVHEKYGTLVGIIFLISGGIVLVNIFIWFIKKKIKHANQKKFKKNSLSYISTLTVHEKALFREFWIHQNRTIRAPIDDPTISNLIERELIYITGTLMRGTLASISVNEFVWGNLKLQDIDIPSKDITEEEKEFIMKNRPQWVGQVKKLENLMNLNF